MVDLSIFETEHFIFRIIDADDYGLYYKLMLDEPVVQWVFREDMEEKIRKDMLDAMMSFYWSPLIEGKERETYTIFLKGTTEFVGEICLYRNENSRPEMGISILEDYRGQGMGKAIIKEWCTWIANNKNVKQLDIHIDEDNVASIKCVEGLGAEYIGNDGSQYYRLKIPIL